MNTKHKYDTLVESMVVLGQQTAHCHAEASRLGLAKTAVWLNDVAHENGRRMNLLMTDIESTLIGNELDAADALKNLEVRHYDGASVPRTTPFEFKADTLSPAMRNHQLEFYASLATTMNLTAGAPPPPSLENLKEMVELLKTPDVSLGEGLFGKPDMFKLGTFPPMIIDPRSIAKVQVASFGSSLTTEHLKQHFLYHKGDANIPEQILDRNGDIVLALCKICGRAEVELSEPCERLVAGWPEGRYAYYNYPHLKGFVPAESAQRMVEAGEAVWVTLKDGVLKDNQGNTYPVPPTEGDTK